MTILEKSQVAQQYYATYRSKTVVSGFEMLVCTDGTRCMFVNDDYEPISDEIVFMCDTRNCVSGIWIHKQPATAQKLF